MLRYDDAPALADEATRALCTSMVQLCAAQGERGRSRQLDGAAIFVSGGRIPTLNTLVVSAPNVVAVAELLDELAATGLPHSVLVRPAALAPVEDLLVARGRSVREQLPLMVRIGAAPPVAATDGLTVERLAPGRAGDHVAVMAAGFEMPADVVAEVMPEEVLAIPDLGCYLGSAGGEAVTTGIGMLACGWVGVFNIATPAAHRRRGHATAITARIVADGLAAGAEAAYLQSSSMGQAVYERLGFRTVERWSIWL
ncbi:GNAT family N-acetyltransferase [Micromonospora sp. MS34]|uniref:GNAT family N-acetyltransferase n=1 Tax=Micromonospora sp. MS34 TaxID=3385971 RepID=UPI0039A33C97